VTPDVRELFVDRVKAIDPVFKHGDLERFWAMLRDLVAVAPERVDLSQKKSHYLASLAARSLARGDAQSALEFLDFADRSIDETHLTPFLVNERSEFREMAMEARKARRGV
jgi:hypothetical protein